MAGEVDEPGLGLDLGLGGEVVGVAVSGSGRCENVAREVEVRVYGGPEVEALGAEFGSKVDETLEEEVEVGGGEARDGAGIESHAIKLVVDLCPYAMMDSSKGMLRACDLVWGKVRSHPWWPGQIIDPSAASARARKYFRRHCLLVAFFGDQSFAWSEMSRIRPFQPFFCQMEKEASSEDFRYAVHCALDEVSRRVELGLACPCVHEYDKIRIQMVVNAGVRDGYTHSGRDSFSNPASFEPEKLAGYVKALGQFPNRQVDKLEFVTAKGQLLAWNRWKGYSHLPEFQVLDTLLADDVESLQPAEDACREIKKQDVAMNVNELGSSTMSKLKRKYISSGISVNLRKRERSLADLLAKSCNPVQFDSNYAFKLGSSCSGKKRKVTDDVKHRRCLSSKGDYVFLRTRRTCRVGGCCLPNAGPLKGDLRTTIFKHGSKRRSARPKVRNKFLSGSHYGKVLSPMECLSTEDIASQLWLVARDPTKGCCFLESVRSFFTEFRNSLQPKLQELKQPLIDHISDIGIPKDATNSVDDSPEFEPVKDSYWTDMIIQSIPAEQSNTSNDEDGDVHVHSLASDDSHLSEQQSAARIPSVEVPYPLSTDGQLEENYYDDSSATALILNFTSLKSVPRKRELNKIFGRYGALKKSKTEVLKKSKRAKVVFCRRADAEAAFSSAGKYSIFGPSLASYRLKYDCCAPTKSSRKRD